MAKRNGDSGGAPVEGMIESPATMPPELDMGPPEAPSVAPEEEERFRVEVSVYYVPHLGHGAVYVPAGTIVTRSSHDLQKLIEQGAKLRPHR
jgi:hypothetical protein